MTGVNGMTGTTGTSVLSYQEAGCQAVAEEMRRDPRVWALGPGRGLGPGRCIRPV